MICYFIDVNVSCQLGLASIGILTTPAKGIAYAAAADSNLARAWDGPYWNYNNARRETCIMLCLIGIIHLLYGIITNCLVGATY